MSDARRYAVWPDPRSRSRSLKGSRPTVPHGTNLIIVIITANKLEYLSWNIENNKFKLSFADILSICQLHISLNRTAQIYLELHFCVELHTKKVLRLLMPFDLEKC